MIRSIMHVTQIYACYAIFMHALRRHYAVIRPSALKWQLRSVTQPLRRIVYWLRSVTQCYSVLHFITHTATCWWPGRTCSWRAWGGGGKIALFLRKLFNFLKNFEKIANFLKFFEKIVNFLKFFEKFSQFFENPLRPTRDFGGRLRITSYATEKYF